MRKRSSWFTKADDFLLECLDEFGNNQPAQIAYRMDEVFVDFSYDRNYLGQRLRILEDYGLVNNLGNGVYSITDSGHAYLAGDLDVGELVAKDGDR